MRCIALEQTGQKIASARSVDAGIAAEGIPSVGEVKMKRLVFNRDVESIDLLDNILYSYSGWEYGTVMAEPKSMLAFLTLLEKKAIQVTMRQYFFRHDIQDEPKIMAVYQELLPKTRWKRYGEREVIRLNALWQLRHLGAPDYLEYIQYRDGACEALCGNISPASLLTHLANNDHLRRFYMFPYPYWNENHTAVYYCLAFTSRAVMGAKQYQESVWGTIRSASLDNAVFPQVPSAQGKADLP